MNESEAREKALGILARYGFTEVNINYVLMNLKYMKCGVSISKGYDTDSSLTFTFYGTTIKKSNSLEFDMAIKKDVQKLMTKARGIAKKTKVEEESIDNDNKQNLTEYKEIHKALVQKKVAFALNIEKYEYSRSAIVRVNGYQFNVNDKDCIVRMRIGGQSTTITASKAVEIFNLLPANTTEEV